ncbi:MAG: hypothetical protein Q9216_003373 [Gyalolechia sp. 2 TL-2023]
MEPGVAAAAYGAETVAEGAVGAAVAIAKPTMPLKATWCRLAISRPLLRSSHSLSVIKGKAYIFGGEEQSTTQPVGNDMHVLTLPSSTVNDVDYQIIPAKGSTENSELPASRIGHTAAVVNDRIYVFGGRDGDTTEPLQENGAVWEYDTKMNYWSRLDPVKGSPHPKARYYHSSTSTVHPLPSQEDHTDAAYGDVDPEAHGTIFIHGGCTASGRLKDVWGFDVAARTWSPFPDPPGEARGGSSLTFTQDRLYRFGGFDGKVQLGGQIDYLDMVTTTFHDQGGRGELAVTSATGKWQTVAPESSSPMPGNRSGAGLHPVTTGQGRNYLILFLGEKNSSSDGDKGVGKFWDDVWSFQLRPEGMTAASFKDATRELVGAKTAEHTWAPVDIPETTMTGGKQEAPGQLGWFASAPGHDLDPGSIVLWGGMASNSSRSDEGWMLVVE